MTDYHCLALSVPGGSTFGVSLDGDPVAEAALGSGDWYLLGDGSARDLLLEMKTQAQTLVGGTWTFALTTGPSTNAAPVITVSCTGDFSLESGTLDLSELGLTDRAVQSDLDLVSSGHLPLLWVPDEPIYELEPITKGVGSQVRTVSGKVYNYERGGPFEDHRIRWDFLAANRATFRDGGVESLENLWRLSRSGRDFQIRVGELSAYPGTLYGTFDLSSINEFTPQRFSPGHPEYSITWELMDSP
jgi:hypothetical protein